MSRLVEFLAFLATLLALRLLLNPLIRRLPAPAWYLRLRERGRPGVPVTSALGAGLLMMVVWWIGELRGIPGAILLAVWLGAPLAAWLAIRRWDHPPT